MLIKLFVLSLLLGTAASSLAQNCESVIALSRTVATTVSDASEVSQHAANFCQEYSRNQSSSRSMSAGASYKFLAASFGSANASTDEVASKYCSASNSSSAIANAFRQYVEMISPNAYAAYETCVRLSGQDLRFGVDVNGILPNRLLITAGFTSSVGVNPRAQLSFDASDGVSCTWQGESANRVTSIATGTTGYLVCRRDAVNRVSTVTLIRTDARSEPLTLRWPAFDNSGNRVDALANLQARLVAAETRLAEVERGKLATDQWPAGSYVLLRGESACPRGFTQRDVHLRAIRQFVPANKDHFPSYIQQGRFGASYVQCHGECGQYGEYYGEIGLSVCVK